MQLTFSPQTTTCFTTTRLCCFGSALLHPLQCRPCPVALACCRAVPAATAHCCAPWPQCYSAIPPAKQCVHAMSVVSVTVSVSVSVCMYVCVYVSVWSCARVCLSVPVCMCACVRVCKRVWLELDLTLFLMSRTRRYCSRSLTHAPISAAPSQPGKTSQVFDNKHATPLHLVCGCEMLFSCHGGDPSPPHLRLSP